MRTFKLLNVVKIVDTEAKARRLEMLGYKEVKEEAPIPEEVAAEEVKEEAPIPEEVAAEEATTEEELEEVTEEVEPEPKKKAPAKKTTKEG